MQKQVEKYNKLIKVMSGYKELDILGERLQQIVMAEDKFIDSGHIRFCDYYNYSYKFNENIEYYSSYDSNQDNINNFVLFCIYNKLLVNVLC